MKVLAIVFDGYPQDRGCSQGGINDAADLLGIAKVYRGLTV